MSELIDRQALKDYVSSLSTHPLNEWDTWGVLAAIDHIPSFSPWHRVEEELPEPHKNVLCMGRKGGCFVGWSIDNADTVKANGYGRAYVHGGNARSFTHWMPLHEPPKEDA